MTAKFVWKNSILLIAFSLIVTHGNPAFALTLGTAADDNGSTINTSLGDYSIATGFKTTSVGYLSRADNEGGTAIGIISKASGRYSSAFGFNSTAGGIGSIAIGPSSNASADGGSIAIGGYSSALGIGSLTMGGQSLAMGNGSVAVGEFAKAGWRNVDHHYVPDPTDVAVDNATAIGNASKAYETGATALGQGATVEVGATNAVALGTGSLATEANTVSVGSNGSERRLTNVADGVNSTDAITVRQLQETTAISDAQINALDGRVDLMGTQLEDIGEIVNRLNDRVEGLESRMDDVGALASAFSALVPNARAHENTQISIGVGEYSSAHAVAIGAFHYVNDRVLINAGFSSCMKRNTTASRVGVTFGF